MPSWMTSTPTRPACGSCAVGPGSRPPSRLSPTTNQKRRDHTGLVLLESTAATHIFAAASLEAHINQRAEQRLLKIEFEYFDRLAPDGKWMILSRLLGASSFDAGKEPFQSLVQLMKWRNNLLHHKPLREFWRLGSVPTFVDKLGLTLRSAERTVRLVPRIVSI